MKIEDASKKAEKIFPVTEILYEVKRNAYIRGYMDSIADANAAPQTFFDQLATTLREMWPPGEKAGKWPWRDSVPNLSKRLKTLWELRSLKDYTIDDCVMAARRYLAQFENNAKYMQTLKYFILKQEAITDKDGTNRYVSTSKFADMIESNPTVDDTAEWEKLFESSNTIDQGRLV